MNSDLINKIKEENQEHIFNIYEKMSEENKEKLNNQIQNINFEQIKQIYNNTKEISKINAKIEHIEYTDKAKLTKEQYQELYNLGSAIIKEGKYAVVTMAGGQGTRLGYTAPKGTFEIGEGINKSLFEALADKIKEAKKEFKADIPWYIMTSNENNKATIEFFEKHNFFELPYENINFFTQGELPMLHKDGKIIIAEDYTIKLGADGNGGIFESLAKSNKIEDLKERKIEWIFISGVDNILAKIIDPVAIGLAIKENNLAVAKSVIKRSPDEKVGVFIKKDGRPSVIEYSEISTEMAEAKNEDGELLYSESYIVMSAFNIKALEKISNNKLPYHKAIKKTKYIDENGNIVEPTEPNAYKYETFLFDAFELLDDISLLRVKREEEFAPLKNANGEDSPETVKKLYLEYIKNK